MLKQDHSAWVEIDLKALRQNYRALKKLVRSREVELRTAQKIPVGNIRVPQILCVVKADAYGHGMVAAARELVAQGTDFLGVSEFREGVVLREHGVTIPILVLETPLAACVDQIVDHDLTGTVCDERTAEALNAYAGSVGKKAHIHIKVDTGMGRLGVPYPEAESLVKKVMRLAHVSVAGLYTHFPAADTDPVFTRRQIDDMARLVDRLDRQGLIIPYIHGANSMGVVRYRTRVFNLVRPGLALYGLYPSAGFRTTVPLKPVMQVKAKVIFVKAVEKGQGISYGRTFIAKRHMRIATIALGYNDGYMRAFSSKADVLIGGKRCRVLGRVTMDQTVVDVTGLDHIRPGAEAVIIGTQKKECVSADELARHAGTINYEVVCSLGNRLPRIYKM